jgi:hypothetical protein
MIQDYTLVLCDATSIAGSAGSAGVGKALDLGAAGKDGWGNTLTESPGEGQDCYFNVQINTAMTGSGTLTVALQSAAAITSSSALTSGVTACSVFFPKASAAGQRRVVSVPMGGLARYLRAYATIGTASCTGVIDAWIGPPADSEAGLK